MALWITTHYPHPVPDTAPWHIYFRTVPKTLPAVGDRVLFYETYQPQADRDRLGRKAIVCAAEVSGGLLPMTGIGPWVHQLPCRNHRAGTPVPLAAIRPIVRGPFFKKTIWAITSEQFDKLEAMLRG